MNYCERVGSFVFHAWHGARYRIEVEVARVDLVIVVGRPVSVGVRGLRVAQFGAYALLEIYHVSFAVLIGVYLRIVLILGSAVHLVAVGVTGEVSFFRASGPAHALDRRVVATFGGVVNIVGLHCFVLVVNRVSVRPVLRLLAGLVSPTR